MTVPRLTTEMERGRQSGLTAEQLSTIQLFDTVVLAAVAAGKLDLNRLAREELADRGIRLNEAYELIQKALSLSPDDPFIQDSLGWVQFKMGREVEALATLEKAHTVRPDPEIAAHLGEVMWSLGKRSEAIVSWENALKESPGNSVLKTVMERLAR